jgi:hypothetical protein
MYYPYNWIIGVMVHMFTPVISAVDCEFWSTQRIDICCFSAKHEASSS